MQILRLGCKGQDVVFLQRKLLQKPDGYFGPKTETAVKWFQTVHGLISDGIVGEKTYAELMRQPMPDLPTSYDHDALSDIQAKYEEGTAQFYEACYKILEFDPGAECKIKMAADRITGKMWPLYEKVESLSGVPAVMIACIHSMECNNHPLGVLHNGERIVGSDKKTTLVPRNRGPFNKKATIEENWIDAAMDALSIDNMWHVPEWSIGWILKQCERFNGTGYITGAGRAELSPYIWANTNINDGFGKYVRDGHFDPHAPTDDQVGVAAIIKWLDLAKKIQLVNHIA